MFTFGFTPEHLNEIINNFFNLTKSLKFVFNLKNASILNLLKNKVVLFIVVLSNSKI